MGLIRMCAACEIVLEPDDWYQYNGYAYCKDCYMELERARSPKKRNKK